VAQKSEQIDHACFVALLAEQLPEVAAQINEYTRGLLTMEMGVLGLATRAAAEGGDWDTVRRHLDFVERVRAEATPEVTNAVYVSYMELLPLWGEESDPPELRALLPVGLAGMLWDMEEREFDWPLLPRPC
jgi:hypothetical protein